MDCSSQGHSRQSDLRALQHRTQRDVFAGSRRGLGPIYGLYSTVLNETSLPGLAEAPAAPYSTRRLCWVLPRLGSDLRPLQHRTQRNVFVGSRRGMGLTRCVENLMVQLFCSFLKNKREINTLFCKIIFDCLITLINYTNLYLFCNLIN